MEEWIKKSDAIEAINKSFDKETLLKCFVRKIAIDAIIQVPSADRPRGEMKSIGIYYKCSVCGSEFDDEITFMGELNYCPACGCSWESDDHE